MSWWHRNRDVLEARQADADAAVRASERQLQVVRDLAPVVDQRVGVLQRLNRENGFSGLIDDAFAYQRRAR